MKKKLFIFGLSLLGSLIQAQSQNGYIPQITPPSPLVQNFRKITEIPVSESNGMTAVEIPLYEIKIKGLTIPISLTYYGGGIRHDQYDGDVGVGWSINAGGYQVNRNLCGKPDEEYDLFDPNAPSSIKEQAQYASYYPSTGWACDAILSIYGYTRQTLPYTDGEYDIFQYSLPSTSGHFLFSRRVRPFSTQILEGTPDVISLDPNSSASRAELNEISITDPQGFQYLLGKDDVGNLYNETVFTVDFGARKTSWPLTKIISPYGENIKFSYFKDLTSINSGLSSTMLDVIPPPNQNGSGAEEGSYSFRYNYRKYSNLNFLTEIASGKETIQFVRFTSGEYKNFIQEIRILNANAEIIKKISFSYIKPDKHKMLEKVIIKGNIGTEEEVYKLEYYPAALASGGFSPDSDQWGYYALYNNNRKPNPVFLHQEFENDSYTWRLYETPKSISQILSGTDVVFTNKVHNPTPAIYYALRKLIYPTGGETEFRYENHQFQIGNQVISGGGLRVKEIVSRSKQTQDSTKTIYKYGIGENGLAADLPNYNLLRYSFRSAQTYKSIIYDVYSGDPTGVLEMPVTTYHTAPYMEYYGTLAHAKYNQVAKYVYQPNMPVSRTVSYYDASQPHRLGVRATNNELYIAYYNFNNSSSPLLSRTMYNEQNQIVHKTEYSYFTISPSSYTSNRPIVTEYYDVNDFLKNRNKYFNNKIIFYNSDYSLSGGKLVPYLKTATQYDLSGANPVTTEERYMYDSKQRVISSSVKTTTQPQDSVITSFTYPVSGELVNKNILTEVIQQQSLKNGIPTGMENKVYPGSGILPSAIQISSGDGTALRDAVKYLRYDSKGNLLEYQTPLENGLTTVILWSYNYTYPIAEIKNATYAQVESVLTSSWINSIAGTGLPQESIFVPQLEQLRNSLPSASVSIYVYEPLVGLKKVIDPSGKSLYYEYDSLGRLKNIKDMYGNLVNEYLYNLSNI